MFLLYAAALGLFFRWSDRWSGGGLGWNKLGHDNGGPLRSHPRNYVFLAVLVVYLGLALPAIIAGAFAVTSIASVFVLLGTSLWAAVQAWPVLAVSGFSFVFWRAFGWDMIFDKASIDPRGKVELIHTFLRHSVFPAVGFGGAFALGLVSWPALLVAPLFGLVATYLAHELAKGLDQGADNNEHVELTRGTAFGVLSGLALGLSI